MKIASYPPKIRDYEQYPAIQNHQCLRCMARIPSHQRDLHNMEYCTECQAFGAMNASTFLYRYSRGVQVKEPVFQPQFLLSESQMELSHRVLSDVLNHKHAYLEAVCGAGKTEIIYETLLYFLKQGCNIAYVIPRTDVVRELTERFKRVFPKTIIKALYASSHDDDQAQLLVSTAHQMIHYEREFDLVILDEADAFPYHGNAFLHRIIDKTLKVTGHLIELSATLSVAKSSIIPSKNTCHPMLPARYHRHPLDSFRIRWMDSWNEGFKWLVAWIDQMVGHPILIFVATIEEGILLKKSLKRHQFDVEFTHSSDVGKTLKIKQFRLRKLCILITTILLERGITIVDLRVAIMNASHPVFQTETLIQICGRVGRHPDFPHGDILLIAYQATLAIHQASQYIKTMNKKAKMKGLIDDEMSIVPKK